MHLQVTINYVSKASYNMYNIMIWSIYRTEVVRDEDINMESAM